MERELTAFLCSRRCPDEAVAAVENWLNTLDPEKDCIVCGGHSGIEKRVVVQLMERGIPLVWMVAEAGNMKWQNLTDTAKMNMAILSEQRELDKNYRAIGEWFVSEYEGEIPDAVKDVVAAVNASKERIAELEASKPTKDAPVVDEEQVTVKVCPVCGAASNDKFCPHCGAPMGD